MENDDVPDWAIERACERANSEGSEWTLAKVKANLAPASTLIAFARYIAQHEKPPVDPDLMLAREIAALVASSLGRSNSAANYRAGVYDNDDEMIAALKILKERK